MASRLDDTGDQAPLSNNGTTTSATSTALILKDDVTGSKLTAEFLNFVPSSITDLTTAFDNIDPALEETWVIDGGFRSITFTDANGTELWEIAHTDGTTTDAYTLTDFQAGTGEVNAIKLEGSTLSNQWADYMVLVDALDVADAAAATDDDALDALQAAAFGNFDLNKISIMAKGIAAPKLSLEFETDSVELTVLDVSLKLTAIGSTASTTFDIDAIQDLNNISGLVDATVKDVTDALSGAVGGSITFNHATHGELMDLTIENFADANKEIERIDLLPEGGLSAGLVNGDNYLMEEHGLIVTYFEGSNLTMSDFYSNVVFENKGFGDLLVPVAP